MADVFQCPVYLDPWEKTQLEGVALMIQRIPDTEERTHHTVTCERWHVRFEEDQDLAVRWIDVGDKYVYLPTIRNTSVFSLNRVQALFTADAKFHHLSIGEVPTHWLPGPTSGAFVCPAAGRIRHYSYHSYTAARVGDPPKANIRLTLNGVSKFTRTIPNSDTVGLHDYQVTSDATTVHFASGDLITSFVYCDVSGEDSLTLINLLAFPRLQWGSFP